MYDALPQRAEDMTITRAELPASRVMLTPPICTMGEDAHQTQYDILATLGNNGRHLMMGDDPRLPNEINRTYCTITSCHLIRDAASQEDADHLTGGKLISTRGPDVAAHPTQPNPVRTAMTA